MTTKQYRLNNLSCANCAAKFERNVRDIATVEDAQLNFGAAKLTVMGEATVEQLDAAGAFDGITVSPVNVRQASVPFYRKKENIVAAIALLFVVAAILFEKTGQASTVVINGLFFSAILVGGLSIFKVGLQNLVKRQFDMKTLMTIAIIGAAIIGEWEEAAIVVFLFAVSEALEAYSMNKARQSIESLMDISPTTAWIERSGKAVEVETAQIEIGDILIVKPGSKIAMDGVVIDGTSTVNEAAITGESLAVVKEQGAAVFAGTINEQGALRIRVTKRVEDTTLAKIIHLVEEAQLEKAPAQRFVDRFAKYYTPAIMLIALAVAVIPPLFTGDWQHWIYQGLAVLVVGCPCALVVSTPVAIVTAIGHAARQGVLIKGGAYLEELSHVKAIAFDKTGTLTKGKPEVTAIYTAHHVTEEQLLQYASAVEQHSQHPLATAIVKRAASIPQITSNSFQSVMGKGAYAYVNKEMVYIGNWQWVEQFAAIDATFRQLIEEQQQSVVAVAVEGKFLGIMTIADDVRAESHNIVAQLQRLHVHPVMLTGDRQQAAQAIGQAIGIYDVRAQLLPDEKLAAIEALQQQYGKVAMIGDGVNDAPALAKAAVGLAMGGAGTDVALETAHIVLMSDDLSKLPYTIRLSQKTLRIIQQNIAFALGLKLMALLLVVPGWLTLWIAIIADMGATLLVVLNALRLLKKIKL